MKSKSIIFISVSSCILTFGLLPILLSKEDRLTLIASLGNRKAMFELSEYHWDTNSGGKSRYYEHLDKWKYWLEKSAENGYVPAMERLGNNYNNRFDPESSKGKRALYWYTKAADGGSWIASLELAQAYTYGYWGLERDKAKGDFYYAKAHEIRHKLGIDQIR